MGGSGPVATDGSTIVVSGLLKTSTNCDGERAEVSEAMLTVLDHRFTYQITDNRLTVSGHEGSGLRFVGTNAKRQPGDEVFADIRRHPTSPTPTPSSTTKVPQQPATANTPLAGRTFIMTRFTTDAGQEAVYQPDATAVVTFTAKGAIAYTMCGEITYPSVTLTPGAPLTTLDWGSAEPMCDNGPGGEVWWSTSNDRWYMSTGFLIWEFKEITGG